MLSRTRGLAAAPENVMITRSIEQGIDLVARTLIAPGDVVVVETFGYPPAWSTLQRAGARLIPLPLDNEGLDIDALESLLQQQRIRAVFVTPHHQFPTTAVMSSQRRQRLAKLSLRHQFAIIEDDYDHEFHYQGNPILPIAAGPNRANVVYVGSLANLLAPGISAGFVVAPSQVFDLLSTLRAATDSRSDAAVECAVAELFEDGELIRHALRMRRTYSDRRDALAAALTKQLGSVLKFRVPDGGMAIWVQVDPEINVAAWSHNGLHDGVGFSSVQPYDFFHRDQPYLPSDSVTTRKRNCLKALGGWLARSRDSARLPPYTEGAKARGVSTEATSQLHISGEANSEQIRVVLRRVWCISFA